MASPSQAAELSALAARLADSAPQPQYIRAYHASPYDFDKFDASKIGTGEGAQMYAHGLYFAQSPSVMEEYYKTFKRLRPNTSGRWSARTVKDAEDTVAKAGSVDVAIQHLEALLPSVAEDLSLRPQVEDAIAYLRRGKAPRTRRYEVEIGYPEASLLDWDKPLREQPEIAAKLPDAEALIADHADGYKVYDWLKLWHGGPQAASKALLETHGIPGIKYQDQLSRGSVGGTRNYVIFPGAEDQIRILRKYAIPGAVGAGAAGSMQDER